MTRTPWQRFRSAPTKWQVVTWILLPVLPLLLLVHGEPEGRARRWKIAAPVIGALALIGALTDSPKGPPRSTTLPIKIAADESTERVEPVQDATTTAPSQPPTTTTAAPTTTTSTVPTTTTTAKPDCQRGDGERDTRNLCLYASRADRQDEDHEAPIGGFVHLAGYTAGVASAHLLDDGLFGRDLVIGVGIGNRDDHAQPYNVFDWRIQTENGQVLDPTLSIRDDDIGFGDLVQGGTVSGSVSFDIEEPGTYYVIYKPDVFNAARGIWAIVV